ncbi:hypothetical protein BDF22DRAFT_676844, partial [Syncephalis plumigaleata]
MGTSHVCNFIGCGAAYTARSSLLFHQRKKHNKPKGKPGRIQRKHLEIANPKQLRNARARESYGIHKPVRLQKQAHQRLVNSVSKAIVKNPSLTANQVLDQLRAASSSLIQVMNIKTDERNWIEWLLGFRLMDMRVTEDNIDKVLEPLWSCERPGSSVSTVTRMSSRQQAKFMQDCRVFNEKLDEYLNKQAVKRKVAYCKQYMYQYAYLDPTAQPLLWSSILSKISTKVMLLQSTPNADPQHDVGNTNTEVADEIDTSTNMESIDYIVNVVANDREKVRQF